MLLNQKSDPTYIRLLAPALFSLLHPALDTLGPPESGSSSCRPKVHFPFSGSVPPARPLLLYKLGGMAMSVIWFSFNVLRIFLFPLVHALEFWASRRVFPGNEFYRPLFRLP